VNEIGKRFAKNPKPHTSFNEVAKKND